ncbi:MAG: FAD-dependent oxidoreductase [Rhizobiaceae bacterium]|nr:FAD-dependent oxidoreductase [Rhizobiaceae bacterium]
MTSEGVVIIGAGECGVRTAFALREHGYNEPISLIGAEQYPPYERPPLSKSCQTGLTEITPMSSYEAAGVDLRLNATVNAIDPTRREVILSLGGTLRYDKLVIATGARARKLSNLVGHQLRTFDDAKSLMPTICDGSRLVIVGAGLIGLELAATARSAGATVTIVGRADRIMKRSVPEPIADYMTAKHEAEGVWFILGVPIANCSDTVVELTDGTRLEADKVVVAIGSVPNTEIAADANLTINNGIAVDGMFRTSDRHIFAAGDCCSFPFRGERIRLENWRAARDQAEHIASVICGSDQPYEGTPWFWSDQYDYGIQIAGVHDNQRPLVRRDLTGGGFIVFQIDENGILNYAGGVGKGAEIGKDIRISEKLIKRGIVVKHHDLANPRLDLKALLKAKMPAKAGA